MIDEKAFIYLLQSSLNILKNDKQKLYDPTKLKVLENTVNRIIEVIEDFPKIEISTYGSENCNPKEAENDNLCGY